MILLFLFFPPHPQNNFFGFALEIYHQLFFILRSLKLLTTKKLPYWLHPKQQLQLLMLLMPLKSQGGYFSLTDFTDHNTCNLVAIFWFSLFSAIDNAPHLFTGTPLAQVLIQ